MAWHVDHCILYIADSDEGKKTCLNHQQCADPPAPEHSPHTSQGGEGENNVFLQLNQGGWRSERARVGKLARTPGNPLLKSAKGLWTVIQFLLSWLQRIGIWNKITTLRYRFSLTSTEFFFIHPVLSSAIFNRYGNSIYRLKMLKLISICITYF